MRQLLLILLVFGFVGCGAPEPRRPVKVKSGSFNASVERSKKLLAEEEGMIDTIISNDSLHNYEHSATGAWYYYEQKNEILTYKPQPDDLVTFTYNVMSFTNDTIYSHEELGVFKYKVDKQELFQDYAIASNFCKRKKRQLFYFHPHWLMVTMVTMIKLESMFRLNQQ